MLEYFLKAYNVSCLTGIITLCLADCLWNKTDSTLYFGTIDKIPKQYMNWTVTDFEEKYAGWVVWISDPAKIY